MNSSFPFFMGSPPGEGEQFYHTHPRCRIAQSTPVADRISGTGEGLRECPFCYLLEQFQAGKDLRTSLHSAAGIPFSALRHPAAPQGQAAGPERNE